MFQGMKSVMVFDPQNSQQETERKWIEWNQHKSAVADKAVPNAEQTRINMRKYDSA